MLCLTFGAAAFAALPARAAEDFETAVAQAGFADAARTERIGIEAPEIAEDGNQIAIRVWLDSPMTAEDHITRIALMAPRNPWPGIATFHLGPQSGRAAVRTRIRLARNQRIAVLTEASTGERLRRDLLIEVTLGGCGG